MKRIRGFGYVGDGAEEFEDELEDYDVELEHGFASEHVEPGRAQFSRYNCPRCNRFLFSADVSLHGIILVRCRKCRREVAIETEPTMQRIGFINPLRKENQENDC